VVVKNGAALTICKSGPNHCFAWVINSCLRGTWC